MNPDYKLIYKEWELWLILSAIAIMLVIGFIVVPSFVNEVNQKREAEKQLIIKMDCASLKDHIIKDDMTYWDQSYLETQYKWRCSTP